MTSHTLALPGRSTVLPGSRAWLNWQPTRTLAPLFSCSVQRVGNKQGNKRRRLCAASTAEGGSLPLSDLQDQLMLAVSREDYTAAASLRDELQRRKKDARLAVEEANRRFYRAFEAGDLKEMEQVWGQGDHVQVIHPSTPIIAGHKDVMESWKVLLQGSRMKILLEDVRIYAGETDAFVTCIEVMEADETRGRIAATNIFEKQGGRWVLIHHQGGAVPIMRGISV